MDRTYDFMIAEGLKSRSSAPVSGQSLVRQQEPQLRGSDLADAAVSVWRLEKYVKSLDVERKTAASSALRQLRKVLDRGGIEILDYTGQTFDPGLAIDVIGRTGEEDIPEEMLLISETLSPLVLQKGEILKYGQVMLGQEVTEAEIIRSAPPKKTPEEIKAEEEEALRQREKMREEVREEVRKEVREEVREEVRKEVWMEIRDAVREEVRLEVLTEAKRELPMRIGEYVEKKKGTFLIRHLLKRALRGMKRRAKKGLD